VQAIDTILAGGTFFGTPPKTEPAGGDKPNLELCFAGASLSLPDID